MIDKRLLKAMPMTKKYIALNVFLQWLSLLCNILIMSVIAKLISKIFLAAISERELLSDAILLVFLIALRSLFSLLAAKASFKTTTLIKLRFRKLIFEKLFKIKDNYLQFLSSGEITQVTSEGVDQLEIYFASYIPQFFYAMLAPITLFLTILPLDALTALVLFICVPLIPMTIIMIQKWAKRLLSKYWDQYTKLGDTFLEDLEGLTTLKLYEADKDYQKKMDIEAENFRKITMKVLTMQLNSISIMDLVAYGGAALGIVLALAAFNNQTIDLNETIFIILLSADFFLPMRLLGSFFHIAMNGMAASDKMFKLLELEVKDNYSDKFDPNGDIELDHVSFNYDQRPIIDDVSIKIRKNTLTSIVGPSGSGKSTIANLIIANLEARIGKIMINGQDVRSIDPTLINRHLTYVGADAYIFKASLREELAIADQSADDQKLWSVLEKVKLARYFENLNGLDTKILEGGKNLSLGQRQRLALARALLHDSKIYIFDEATSNIDMESEEAIMEVVRSLRDKTVILISHRLANVVSSDMIYCLERGRVKEEGTHKELLEKTGLYRSLFLQQHAYEDFMMEDLYERAV